MIDTFLSACIGLWVSSFFVVLGIIAIAAVIVVVTLVKRKKKKAEEAFLAEEDDFAPEDVDYYETMPNQSSQNREGRDRNEHF